MTRFAGVSAIAPDLGRIFVSMGLVSCLPLLVGVLYREWSSLPAMAWAPLIFILFGLFLTRVPGDEREPPLSIALGSVALIWLVASFIGALPFTLGIGMPYTDAVFEAMSGWTCTGLSLIPDVDAVSRTLLFWRSLMQWMGGIGVVALTVALASRSSLTSFRLYRSEGRSETLMPSVVATAVQMWRIYLLLTLAGVGLILLSGVSFWDAVNICMTAIATGGFSVHTDGILYYDNALLEILIIPIMIAGALPFKIYYLIYFRHRFSAFGDYQAYLLLLLIVFVSAVVVFDLVFLSAVEPLLALRQGVFMVASAITCTGFNNALVIEWSSVTVLFISFFMLIGGSSGSTAGGIKLSRIILGGEALLWWFRRLFRSGRTLVPFRHEGRHIERRVAEYEISKNMLIVVLFFVVVFLATLTTLHLEGYTGFDSSDVIFDVVSAMANVGLSTGYVNPGMSAASKWLFIAVMWVGRLEVIPVIALAMGLFRQIGLKRSERGTPGE